MTRYPALEDLSRRARQRLPHFVWEHLDSGTGDETLALRTRTAFDRIQLMPSVLHGEITPDLSVSLLGQTHPLPVGIAPVGMSGLIWPEAERHLARAAVRAGVPYCLSTVATLRPEDLRDDIADRGWFQLYPARDKSISTDMLRRAREAGFHTLVLTLDVPVASRRERLTRSGLTSPPRLTPRLLAQIARCPAWALAMARSGLPRMALIDDYAGPATGLSSTAHAGYMLRTSPDWDYLRWLRDRWDGPFVVKGVLDPRDAALLERAGLDAIWISNHGGRQFDGAPLAIEMLPRIRAETPLPLIIDGGFRGALDMMRAMALGADFLMLGRAWHCALAALGPAGPDHLAAILRADFSANMGQIGAKTLDQLPGALLTGQ